MARTKQISIDRIILWLLLGVLGGVIIHAPITVWLSSLWPGGELLIKSWKEIVLLAASLLLVYSLAQKHQLKTFARDKLLWLVAAIGIIHIVLLVVLNNAPFSELAGLMIDLRYYLYFGLVYCYLWLHPEDKKYFIATFFGGALVVAVFAVLQIFVLPKDILAYIGYSKDTIQPYLTVDLNEAYVRINSTLRGPNPLGAYAIIVLCYQLVLIAQRKVPKDKIYKLSFIVLGVGSLAALWWSYSRSAALGLMVSLLVFGVVAGARHMTKSLVWGVLMACLVAGLVGSIVLTTQHEFVSNVILHENRQGGSEAKSNEGHLQSIEEGIDGVIDAPEGNGIGSTGSASLLGDKPKIIEDQYIAMTWESGWLGLLLQLGLFAVIMAKLWKRREDRTAFAVLLSGVGLAVVGLLLPVWFDDTVGIVWWGLAAVALTSLPVLRKESHERTRHKKAKRTA